MARIILLIINFIILFFVLKFLTKALNRRLTNANKFLRFNEQMKSKLPMFALVLSIINLWIFILGKFYIVSFIFFPLLMACVIFMGLITDVK